MEEFLFLFVSDASEGVPESTAFHPCIENDETTCTV